MLILEIFTILGVFNLFGLANIAQLQFWSFGYLGYIWLLVVAFFIYRAKTPLSFKGNRFLEKALGVMIGIFALLVLQGLFFEQAGILGVAFNSVLAPIITHLGVFILVLFCFAFSIVLYSGKSFKELAKILLRDLQEDLKQSQIPKEKIAQNKQNLKNLLLRIQAFFSLPSPTDKQDSENLKKNSSQGRDSQNVSSDHKRQESHSHVSSLFSLAKENNAPRALTLEELIEQSKNNPPPTNFAFNLQEDTEGELEDSTQEISQDETHEDFSAKQPFESEIDALRQEVELPTREDNPLENATKEQESTPQIRIVSPQEVQQQDFDMTRFQLESMENLENFKRFEHNLLYRNQTPEEEVIRLIKKDEYEEIQKSVLQVPTPAFAPKESPVQSQNLPQESETTHDSTSGSTKPKPIKAYPKNLYAATPFSAYYDKEPVGTHDCLVQENPINKDSFQESQLKESQSNTAPSTIFYYGKIKSTRPMQPQEMQQIQESLPNDSKTTNEPPLQAEPAALNHIIKQVIQEFMESQSPQTPAVSNAPQEASIQEVIKESPQLPNPPQEKAEASFHYTPSFAANKIPSYGYGLEKESEKKANVAESQNAREASLLPKETLSQESSQNIETSTPEVISLFDSKGCNMPPKQNVSPNIPMQSVQAESCVPFSKQTPAQSSHNKDSSTLVQRIVENERILSTLEISNAPQNGESKDFILPKLEFLQAPKEEHIEIDEGEIDRKINDLLSKLRMFKIEGDIVRTYSGPIVTTFEFRPSPNVKVSRILTLQDDLAMALRAKTIRIQAPVPGKDVVGIEIPNIQIETIYLREILENPLFLNSASPLTLALGKDIVGNPFVTDLKKLPHLLIAGTTGSGKSVGINAMILSLLYKNSPKRLKLIMIDPKMLEFSIYNEIPHLLTPVITQPKKAIIALDNTVKEMERRYALMSEARIKNIEGYNQKAEVEGFEPFPYIVVIIDELADLMMSGGKEAEVSISRLAQMARASGIHLIVATQRPSVDVVTGLIKANLPSRISYKVGQKIDSKVILDSFGAESLLGRGDMLFTPPGGGIVRLHAPWSTETEIEKIVEFIKSQCPPQYDENFMPNEDEILGLRVEGETDELYEEAKRIILSDGKTSISYIQRRLGIGYNKAANIIEQMQSRGFLSEPNSKGVREILGD